MLMNVSLHLWASSPPPSVSIRALGDESDKLFSLCISFGPEKDFTLFTRGVAALEQIRTLGERIIAACEKIEPTGETDIDTGWVDDSPTGQFMARTTGETQP